MTALATLGTRLRDAGLSSRALAAWAGTDRLSALPALLPTLASRPLTPASTLLALFVAGVDVPATRIVDGLQQAGLVEVTGDVVHARVALLPLGPSLLVCDRLDTSDSLEIVCWPDDSSYHLARALPPGRAGHWLDLGCGSAFAPLLRPELAHAVVATDLNERAVRYARLGVELSGIRHVDVATADLGDGVSPALHGRCDLVSCNAPIPGESTFRAHWRVTDTAFIDRLFEHARRFVAPDGLVVVHAALDALEPVIGELPGHRVLVAYTPAGEGVRGFAVAWWQPDGEDRRVRARRPLAASHPHLTHADRIEAMAGTLPPL